MLKKVRIARIIFALIFFAVITLSFLFFSAGEKTSLHAILHFQFVPALMSFFAGGALFFIFILLITIVFGRVYCSFICPLGIWQDISTWVARLFKTKKQRRYHYKKPHDILRYGILIIVTIALILGVSYPLAFLDPYSIYGRIASNLFNGAAQGINNLLSSIFSSSISYVPFVNITLWTFSVAVAFFCLVTVLSAFWGRLYCNSICPVGSFLGIIGKYSMFRISINDDKCISCGLCGFDCKSNCINSKQKKIDNSRCVVCFNCAKACKEGAIEYKFAWKKIREKGVVKPDNKVANNGRRDAILALGTVGAVLVTRKFGKNISSGVLVDKDKSLGIVPPGGVSVEHLKEFCTACQACVSACPRGIIKPALGQYGIDGFMMPVLSYEKQFCGYDCNICSQVCPNRALLPISLEEKKLTQIGRVKFIAKNCIVYLKGTDCGACEEHCPTKAIKMVPFKNGLYFPSVHRDICIGCGGCEYVCPATPKAMTVVPNRVHVKAEKPKVEKQEEKKVSGFGF
ncbi:MAG: 4Fe-4S binding protein [Bacteroidales bacterium]|nr:4Fe-4S binding protein [Bacteroidales bacterium]